MRRVGGSGGVHAGRDETDLRRVGGDHLHSSNQIGRKRPHTSFQWDDPLLYDDQLTAYERAGLRPGQVLPPGAQAILLSGTGHQFLHP
jgi:hypothetical protein